MGVTPNLGLVLPIVNDSEDIWGSELNNDLAVIDALGQTVPEGISASGTSTPSGVQMITVELCTAGAGGINRTAADAIAFDGHIFIYKKVDASPPTAGLVIISSAQLIDGLSNYTLVNQNQYVWIIAGGGTWNVIGGN